MSNSFYVSGKVPSFNEVINATKSAWGNYAKMKKNWTSKVHTSILEAGLKRYKPIHLSITWYEKTIRRDPDNVAYAVKFIFDGLVAAKIIDTDGWANVAGWSNTFVKADDYGFNVLCK